MLLAVAGMGGSLSGVAGAEDRTFTLDIRQRTVRADGGVIRVTQGDTVTLRWTTDETVTIHLHGYDIEKVIRPGTTVEFTFTAYATGRFPLTAHGFGERARGQRHGETPLVYLEVLPR